MNHPTSDPADTPEGSAARPETSSDAVRGEPGRSSADGAESAAGADPSDGAAGADDAADSAAGAGSADAADSAAGAGSADAADSSAGADAAASAAGADPSDSAATTGSAADSAAGASASTSQSGTEVTDGGNGLDIEALADSDPRSKAELMADLLAAEAKRDEYLDDLRRSHADFENYRRRVLREGAIQRAAGKADVAGALLEVLDDLDRTLVAAEGSPDPDLHTGVRLVSTKLMDALRHLGLERIDATEVVFDPEVHEAVQQQPGDGIDGEPQVVTVLRPGYRMDDRVLRAAMVAVQG